jgi:hypothetical protein
VPLSPYERGAATSGAKARVSLVTSAASTHAAEFGNIVVCATRYGHCNWSCAAGAAHAEAAVLLRTL